MTYRSMLTILPVEETIDFITPAVELAKALEAHLDIVIVGVLSSPSDYFYGGIGDDSWQIQNTEIYKQSEDLNEEVEDWLAKAQISANVTTERQFKEITGSVLRRYTLCTDLNVLSSHGIHLQGDVVRSYYRSLIDAGKPVIILKENLFDTNDLSTVLLAWNGKPEAAKAFHHAFGFLQQADQVHLVMVDPEKSELGENPGDDMATYIARHGVNVVVDIVASGGNSVAATLLQRVNDIDADLLVMGAYGTTKLREWLIGGTTQEILKNANVPIFLSH